MKINMIYMAAGNSRRFGSNKLLYELEGKPMYRHFLERLLRICGRHDGWRVFVVSQYGDLLSGVRELAENMPAERGETVIPVFCGESRNGASYTVRAGLSAACERAADMDFSESGSEPQIGRHAAAYVFFASDQPYLSEKTAEEFLLFMERAGAELGCVTSGGETGNPVWFTEKYVPELMELTGDRGGKKVLKAHMDRAVFYEVADPGELCDLDEAPDMREQGYSPGEKHN